MFFLGEIYVDLPLPVTAQADAHCGSCQACIDVCPTQAIVAPYRLDARRCISYLTIEHEGAIPIELRALMGNRILGCDDCQLVCPWNKYARRSSLPDFDAQAQWTGATLLQLWAWSDADFLQRTEGSAIRRIGYSRWRRNLAVALGNALRSARNAATEQALQAAWAGAEPLVTRDSVLRRTLACKRLAGGIRSAAPARSSPSARRRRRLERPVDVLAQQCVGAGSRAASRSACAVPRGHAGTQRIAQRHRQVAPPARVADAADRAAFGAAQELGLVPGPQRQQRGAGPRRAGVEVGQRSLRRAYLFHGQASWQSSQP